MTTFDWRSRLAWIGRTDSGVVRQRLYDRNITSLGLSVLDPGATTWANAIRGEGKQVFFYSDPHWFGLAGDGSALKYRQRVDADLSRLALPGEMVMLDLEFVTQEYLRRLLFGAPGNRGLFGSNNPNVPTGTQAGRPFAYTNMPFQNHTVVDMQALYDAGAHWFTQLYYGDMAPADASADLLEIVRDWEAWAWDMPIDAGGSRIRAAELVHPFYDGLRIANDQRDGAYFTAERIAGVFSPTFSTVRHVEARMSVMTKEALRAHYTALAAA